MTTKRAIERERRRIRAAFGAALVAASAAAAAEACGAGSSGAGDPPGGDASIGDGGGSSIDGANGDGGAVGDAALDGGARGDAPSCAPTYYVLDGATLAELGQMPDADLCNLVQPCGFPQYLGTQGCLVIEEENDGAPIPDSGFGCNIAVGYGCVNGAYVPPPGPETVFTCTCDLFIQGGRRTGCTRRGRAPMSTTASFLAAMAREERASIAAFERLARELSWHRAPRPLVAAAARAAADEARHARAMDRLARAHGAAEISPERASAATIRSLEAVARENAVEGCVRETFAALLARWQAAHAGDREVARAFAKIARDEARHAALAWAVAGWIEGRVDAAARGRVARARRDAARKVARSLDAAARPALVRDVGVATPAEARALFGAMARALGV